MTAALIFYLEEREMQETLLKIAATINTYLSDYILIFLLVGVGLFYSIKTASSRSAASARACGRSLATCPSAAASRSAA